MSPDSRSVAQLRLSAALLCVGSGLLFWLQPMRGRMLLPDFGSSAGVWIACLAVFQILLLIGYVYGLWLLRLPVALQRMIHLATLAGATAWTLLGFGGALSEGTLPPELAVSWLLIRTAGPVFVALSAGNVIVQRWCVRHTEDRTVYRLYAYSNIGSFAGLFAYPLLVEPFLALPAQQALWNTLLIAYAIGLFALATKFSRHGDCMTTPDPAPEAPASGTTDHLPRFLGAPVWWFVLPGVTCALMVAVTSRMTLDLTPIPLLWAVLLGAFLLSYVTAFRERSMARLNVSGTQAALLMAFLPFMHLRGMPRLVLLIYAMTALFVVCHWLHAWLYASRPAPQRLSFFYLGVALGGAAGGSLASYAAPFLFRDTYEYPIFFAVAAVLCLFFRLMQRGLDMPRTRRGAVVLLAIMLTGTAIGYGQRRDVRRETVLKARSFYGTLEVRQNWVMTQRHPEGAWARSFYHGQTVHGEQIFLPGWRTRPTAYFTRFSGIGQFLLTHPKRAANEPKRVGIVGLGIGVLAAYAQPGDTYVWYEIDPAVVEIAMNTNLFTYIADCRATQHIVTGDARLALEKERRHPGIELYDVLIMDAFSSDAPPLHLATREAFELYAARLKPDGVLAINASNIYMHLIPLSKRMGAEAGLTHIRVLYSPPIPEEMQRASLWAFLSRQPIPFETHASIVEQPPSMIEDAPLLTDDSGSVLQLIDPVGLMKKMLGKK